AWGIETTPSNEFRWRLVDSYYARFLHRPASPAEIMGWVNQLAAGATQQQVEAQMLSSGEFFGLCGNDKRAWLNAIYIAGLGRPNSEGAFLPSVGDSPALRQFVATAILTSIEASQFQVNADYQQYLGRRGTGDPGAPGFASQLAAGVPHGQIVAQIPGSVGCYLRQLAFPP